MRLRIVATMGLASSLLLPRLGSSLTLADCELWRQQLREETSGVQPSDNEAASERDALVKKLDRATLGRKGAKTADSVKDVSEFKKRAARLAAQGKVSQLQGDRLNTLSDTFLHCVERVDAEGTATQ